MPEYREVEGKTLAILVAGEELRREGVIYTGPGSWDVSAAVGLRGLVGDGPWVLLEMAARRVAEPRIVCVEADRSYVHVTRRHARECVTTADLLFAEIQRLDWPRIRVAWDPVERDLYLSRPMWPLWWDEARAQVRLMCGHGRDEQSICLYTLSDLLLASAPEHAE